MNMTEYTLIKKFLSSKSEKAKLAPDPEGFLKKHKQALKTSGKKLLELVTKQGEANRVKNTLINSALTTESIRVCYTVNKLLGVIIDSLTAMSKKKTHTYHHELSSKSLYLTRLAFMNNKLYYRINNCLITSDYTGSHEALYDLIQMEIKRATDLAKADKFNKCYFQNIYKGVIVVTNWYFKNK